jgi:CRP/FNR family cyclic AMP-dependent transcriptional regulator
MSMANTSSEALQSLPIFSGLSKGDLKKVERLMVSITVKPGKELIRQGNAGKEAFFIVSGTATVRRGSRVLAQIGAGDVVGEMSVLSGQPSVASVTADTEMTVEVLNRREFSSLLDEVPSLMKKILVGAMERLHAIDAGVAS